MAAPPATRPRLTRRGRWATGVLVAAAAAGLAATAVTAGGLDPAAGDPAAGDIAADAATPSVTAPPVAVPTPPPAPSWAPAVPADPGPQPPDLLAAGPEELLRLVATDLLEQAPLVVLAPRGHAAGVAAAAALAEDLAAPLLLGPPAAGPGPVRDAGGVPPVATDANDEVLRALGTELVVAVGDVARPRAAVRVHRTTAAATDPVVADLVAAARGRSPGPRGDVAVIRADDPAAALAGVTARAAGIAVVTAARPDPRADPALREALADAPDGRLRLLGTARAWDGADRGRLAWQLEVARRGAELPGGGQLLFPDRRFVALYGNPAGAALGVLGEQPAEAAVERARTLAATYAELSDIPVVPAFEIIATVASASAGPEGDYSRRTDRGAIEHWVDVAEAADVYVVLDLQPGRTDFLSQAREYEDLLARPHVGLALDPEWRLGPGEVHLRRIGSVAVEEVNEVAGWLADLTRREALPQKLLIVHQFTRSMVEGRARLDTSRDELAVLIHADGQGSQPAKLATYRALTTQDVPPGVWWGWKNFHDEDTTLRSPADTLAVRPEPFFVSYQ